MPLPNDLRWFAPGEFSHPGLVDPDAARCLDAARGFFGKPIYLTSDARTTDENDRAGGAPTSLHLSGRAFDLKYPASATDLYQLVDALCLAATTHGYVPEIGLYPFTNVHVHFGLSRTGQARLYVK